MRIIGLSGDYVRHDSSLCLVEDGVVRYACAEERFSRLKNDPRAPLGVLSDVLERYDLTLDDIDAFAVGMPPFRFTKGLLSGGAAALARTLAPVALASPRRFAGYFLERLSDGRAKRAGFEWLPREKVRYVSHYLSHGASAYRTSGYDAALCVTLDAAGSDYKGRPHSGAVFRCRDGRMDLLETIPRMSSLACFYNAVTQACAFRPVGEDWKLMGLSAFGDPEPCLERMRALAPRFENGRWQATPSTMEAKLIDRPAFLRRTRLWRELADMVDRHGDRDVAAAAQRVFEEHLLEYFDYLLASRDTDNVALAGGGFHNIKFLMRLQDRHPGLDIHVHPAAGDPGTAVGAALELHGQLSGRPAISPLQSMALGPEFSEADMLGELTRRGHEVAWERPGDSPAALAALLAGGEVAGLFQGRAEWGPRALGQRSVIADPRSREMQTRINSVLKNREWFMPFAPSVLEEDGPDYFENYVYSPYMTKAFRATDRARQVLAAAVHLDGTARPQIVRREVLPHYHAVISAFRELTGVGGVLNTSFNRHGLPVVNSPADALDHLSWGCVDVLALGPFLVRRTAPARPFRKRIAMTTDELIKKWTPFDARLQALRDRRLAQGEALEGDAGGVS